MDDVIKNVHRWLDGDYSEETKQKIRTWAEIRNFDLINDAFGKELEWAHGGIRAKTGIGTNRINHYTIAALAQAYVNYLKGIRKKEKPVVMVAYDNRQESSRYAEILTEVFSANTVDVWVFDILMPLPVLAHGIKELGCEGGMMVTGGHNEASYSGVKFLDDEGVALSPEKGHLIIEGQRAIKRQSEIQRGTDHDYVHMVPEEVERSYVNAISNHFIFSSENEKKSKICYVPWYGSGALLGNELLGQCGFHNQMEPDEHYDPSLDFNGKNADPSINGNLSPVFSAAGKENADLIVATGCDCASATVAARTSKGEFQQLTGQELTPLIIDFLLDKLLSVPDRLVRNKRIAITRTICPIAREIIKLKGFEYLEVNTGLTDEVFRNRQVLFGIDGQGGLIMPEVSPVRDGLLMGVLAAEIANAAMQKNKTLWNLLDDLYAEYGVQANQQEEVTFTGPYAEKLADRTIHFLQTNYPKELFDLIRVEKFINHADGSIISVRSGEVDLFQASGEMLLQFRLSEGTNVFIRPSLTAPSVKYQVSCQQLVEKRADIPEIKINLIRKADRIIQFFKNL